MRKIFAVLILACLMSVSSVFSEETEISSEVLSIDPNLEFFIIKNGEDAGIEIGDGLIVHREGEKLAEAWIIEVRENVSAAEILSLEDGKQIMEGDTVLLVKDSNREEIEYESEYGVTELTDITTSEDSIGADIINAELRKDSASVFSYTYLVLRENGYSLTYSNRAAGILSAVKLIDHSLLGELWADIFAAIDHKLVISIIIKDNNGSTGLSVSAFNEHFQKGKHIKRPVGENSKYYNQLVTLVSEIKQRSEH
jgi:hypothetical protein